MRGTLLLGTAAAGLLAAAPAWAQASSGVVTYGSMTVMDPAQVTQTSDLSVGAVSRPAKGATTANAQAGSYTVTGLGGDAYTISTPTTVVLTRSGGAEEVTLTLKPSQTGGTFAGPMGMPTSAKIGLTGTVPVSSEAKAGVYRGKYDVTVAFQ